MSNVLIGIIGVVLFIGLALAGSLFLGSRFNDAGNVSKASAYMQSLSQVSHAVSMYQVNEGRIYTAPDAGLLISAGYLKSEPTFTQFPVVLGNDGGKTVTTRVGANGPEVCREINRRYTGSTDIPSGPVGAAGCYTLPNPEGKPKYFAFTTL